MPLVRLTILFLLCILYRPAGAQLATPLHIHIAPQFFGTFCVQGWCIFTERLELKPGVFTFESEAGKVYVTREADGLSVSEYSDGSAVATVYFGAEVTTSDFVQVRGRVLDLGTARYFVDARVTLLRVNGINVSP
jgi:hypothetical protein